MEKVRHINIWKTSPILKILCDCWYDEFKIVAPEVSKKAYDLAKSIINNGDLKFIKNDT